MEKIWDWTKITFHCSLVKGLNSPGKPPLLANLLFSLKKAQKYSFSFYLILFPLQHKYKSFSRKCKNFATSFASEHKVSFGMHVLQLIANILKERRSFSIKTQTFCQEVQRFSKKQNVLQDKFCKRTQSFLGNTGFAIEWKYI